MDRIKRKQQRIEIPDPNQKGEGTSAKTLGNLDTLGHHK